MFSSMLNSVFGSACVVALLCLVHTGRGGETTEATRFQLLDSPKGPVASITANYAAYDKSYIDNKLRSKGQNDPTKSPETLTVALFDSCKARDSQKIMSCFRAPQDRAQAAADIAANRVPRFTKDFQLINKFEFGPYTEISAAPILRDPKTGAQETGFEVHVITEIVAGEYSVVYFKPTDLGGSVFDEISSANSRSLLIATRPDVANQTVLTFHKGQKPVDADGPPIRLAVGLVTGDSDPGLRAFTDRLVNVMTVGSDDALRRLFDVASAKDLQGAYGDYFDTVNGQQYVDQLRDYFRSHPNLKSYGVAGEPMSYLIFTSSPQAQPSAAPTSQSAAIAAPVRAQVEDVKNDRGIVIFRLRSSIDRFLLTTQVDHQVELLDSLLIDPQPSFAHPALLVDALVAEFERKR